MSFQLRFVQESDAAAIAEIYRPYVENTSISFEYDAPSSEEFLQRIRSTTADFPWIVCLFDNEVIGYAYAIPHRNRTAYQWAADVTIYFSAAFHRKGIAKITYETLFSILKLQGIHTLLAGISIPNEKSVGFHTALGFELIGTYTNIGYKFGKWNDTQWYQRPLNDYTTPPSTPKKFPEVINSTEVLEIIQQANQTLTKM